ncbi:MAG: hypothetical protein MPJ50_01220 [Pirellulales bacterium]|nr:hypothetical protein [Pirellulales bacterium]
MNSSIATALDDTNCQQNRNQQSAREHLFVGILMASQMRDGIAAAFPALTRTGEIDIGQVFLAFKGWAQTLHAQQLTSNGTANITGNPDVKLSSMLTINPLWRSAARVDARNTPHI